MDIGTSQHMKRELTVGQIMRNVVLVFLSGRGNTLRDWSVVVTSLMLGLALPRGLPLWMIAIAAFVGVAVGKFLFGKLGFNIHIKPEVYISYAWARERQNPLVEELCDSLAEQGLHVRRDSTELQPGDRISRYMERLSAGRCVVLVLSESYLRSEDCMTELCRLYTNAGQRDEEFLRRIVPLVQGDARIGSPRERIAHAVHWKREYDALDTLIREHGVEVAGKEIVFRFFLIGEFFRQVGDILTYVNDVLVPRDRPSLSGDGFALVRDLIDRALA